MTRFHASILVVALLLLSACASAPAPEAPEPAYDPAKDMGLQWVKRAAEYRAITTQVYRNATAALPAFIDDKSWSAMPEQTDAEALPPAVILDVDETVVSNVDFQLTFERPFANHKLNTWSSSFNARPIDGVRDFVVAARTLGVTVFFVTNRPCEVIVGNSDPCPQKTTTVDDIREVGIDVEPEYVMLSGERPGWDREKLVRRKLIARTHRVIMLIGDDYGDFVPCARKKVVAPCSEPATEASRAKALETYDKYWGSGWYILPNPMHGSWTSVR